MRKIWIAWVLFAIYATIYFALNILGFDTQFTFLLVEIFSLVISVFLVVRNGFCSRRGILISCLFTGLYGLSRIYHMNLFVAVQAVIVFLASIVSFRTIEKYEENSIKFLKSTKKGEVIRSILLGLVVGIVWGVLNLFLMKASGNSPKPGNILKAFIVSLDPAIAEEIACRTIFGALVLSLNGGSLDTRAAKFTCWFMMIIPHVIPHMVFSLEDGLINGVISWVVILLLYVGVFGIVFATLQKKRDIASAMVAHGLVDFIRFSIFGV